MSYDSFKSANRRTIRDFNRATRQYKRVEFLLDQAGIIPVRADGGGGSTFHIELTLPQLRSVRKALRIKKFERVYSDLCTIDTPEGEKDGIGVLLKCERYSCLRILYKRVLHAGDKCSVVEMKSTPYTYKALVCS